MRAGVLHVSGRCGGGIGIDKLVHKDPATIATMVAREAELLLGWPGSIQQFADERMAETTGDIAGYDEIRRDILWIARSAGQEERKLVAKAFPHLGGRKIQMFAKPMRYYSASETNRHHGTSSQELGLKLGLLRDAEALRHAPWPTWDW